MNDNWTRIDQETKLLPSFMLGKRSADYARRFMVGVANRLIMPSPYESDAHTYNPDGCKAVAQIRTDCFQAYPEPVDLAFGLCAIRHDKKEHRTAAVTYTPSDVVGTKRTGIRGIQGEEQRSICTNHVKPLNGTQRLILKRLNRLTLCFSKKLRNLAAAFAMFAAYYNFCWQTRTPLRSGQKRPTAAMMAKLAGHVWGFDELFDAVTG